MNRSRLLACLGFAVLLCAVLVGCGGESEPQQVVNGFTDEELDAAWAAAEEEVNLVEALGEKVTVMKGFLAKYPQSHRTDNAVNVIFHFQGEKMGDLAGAIAYVSELRKGLTDPRVAFDVDLELARAYARSGDVESFNELAEAHEASEDLTFGARLNIIKAAIELEAWEIVQAYAAAGEPFCTEEFALKDNEGWEPSPKELAATVNNRIGRVQLYQGWAKAKMGESDEALAHFAEADKYVTRSYVGIPHFGLNTIWAETLIKSSMFDEAIDKLAPAALIIGDEKAMDALRGAYAAKHGSEEGLEDFLRAEHPRHAKIIDAFELPDYDGQRHSLDDLKGEVTVITVWSPTCGGCLKELPRLEELWRKYRDDGLSVIALETSMDNEKAQEFIDKKGLSFHLLINEAEQGNDVVYGTLEITGKPTSYIIDREGRIMHYHFGFYEGDEKRIEDEILGLLRP